MGALLATTVRQALRQAAALTPADTGRLSGIVVDLVDAVLAHELESGPETAPSCTGETMLLRVRDFMLRHLADPKLSPAIIAAAHSMSVRSLHRLFEAEGATVSAWIRERRLEHCRRDLADPLRGRQPIRAIAARRGFTDQASFSRAFRSAYGLSPQEYRQQCFGGWERPLKLRWHTLKVRQHGTSALGGVDQGRRPVTLKSLRT
ncbi:helix-turn-helix domain-containing protein [Streptomyces sp. TG1A-60]|uniref:helix-turn-helix domain-containing protein n=1 Tax=Streptomyces sp. TG1A-60 TaxID=3129111 RepID=UPI0030D1470B